MNRFDFIESLFQHPITHTHTHTTNHQTDVLDLSNAHVDLIAFVDGQADVEQVVLVGHVAQFHEGQQVTLVVATLVLMRLQDTARDDYYASDGTPTTRNFVSNIKFNLIS